MRLATVMAQPESTQLEGVYSVQVQQCSQLSM